MEIQDPTCSTRSAIASTDITPGTQLCHIPNTLLLSETVVRKSVIGSRILTHLASHGDDQAFVNDKAKHPHADILLAMAAFMVYEFKVMGASSHWYAYLASLPENYTLPLSWGEQRAEHLLRGTPLVYMVKERLAWLRHGARVVERACCGLVDGDGNRIVPESIITEESLLWAASAVWSRAFPKARHVQRSNADTDIDTDKASAAQDWIALSEICLYPILDMLNHRRGHKIEWHMGTDGVSFIAVDGTRKGDEVFNNYGPKGNENLLSNYGFVIENNPEDYHKVHLSLRDDDPLLGSKQALINSDSCRISLVHLIFADEDLPGDMVAAARVLVANESDINVLKQRQYDGDETNASHVPISMRNELVCMSTLHDLLADRLADVVDGDPDYQLDMKLYPDDNEPRTLARIYRHGQRTILEQAVAASRRLASPYTGEETSPITSITTDWINDMSIHITNPHLDTTMKDFIAFVSQPQSRFKFDEDTLLALSVINECRIGDASYWSKRLTKIMTPDCDTTRRHVLSDTVSEIQTHFDRYVWPQLRAFCRADSASDTIRRLSHVLMSDADAFIAAACATECLGARLSSVLAFGDICDHREGKGSHVLAMVTIS